MHYRSLVLSVLLHGCESWTLTADLERRIQVFENKCNGRRLDIGLSYREHKTNESVWHQVSILAGLQEHLLSTVKRRKLSWFGHICRHDTLPKIHTAGLRGRKASQRWTAQIVEEQQQGMDQSADFIIASRCRGQASMCGHHSGSICRGYPDDAWASRVLID